MNNKLDSFFNAEVIEDEYRVDVRFNTKADVTDRTVKISEAFGLGIDETKEFIVFDDINIKIRKDDIVYITGDSGSGKSTLLKELKKKLDCIEVTDLTIDENEVLIEGVGKDLNEAVKLLSLVGLNDAFLFIRRYKELSDGQKYRYKVAKMLQLDKQFLLFDEFCATLDRETAKIIAFNLQKVTRDLKKGVIVATTHTDLKDDLNPSVYVFKKFEREVEINYYPNVKNKVCSIVKNIKVGLGTIDDYNRLKQFHYKDTSTPAVKNVYKLTLNNEVIGVNVVAYPHLQLRGRNVYFGKRFAKSTTESTNDLNKNIECISRVVLHPKYRGIGLAYYFLKEYFKLTESPYVETVAVMANYNPFFEKAGMTKIDYDTSEKIYDELVKRLVNLGFNLDLVPSSRYTESIYNTLNNEQRLEFDDIYKRLVARLKGIRGMESNTDNKFKSLKKLLKNNKLVYLIIKLREE